MVNVSGKANADGDIMVATANGGDYDGFLKCFMDQGSVESRRYYLCRKTVFEMLNDRGYNVPESELTRSLDQFRAEFGQHPDLDFLRIRVPLRSDPSNKILVIFLGTSEINIKTIRGIYGQIMNKETLKRLILIVQSKMTSYSRKELQKYPFQVEIFKMGDLLVNIARHVLQPKYGVLTAHEKLVLLTKLKIEEKQLPHMLETDAIARYYGLEKGKVLKVTFNGQLVDDHVTYRCVV
ncbi:hypothetical protein L6164_023119 [Bauhinia variegata]|uniref:Uncharacterized protein n=1 Tax=Bauhinia variegata TaxID=167791 RepID=A0ACB9MIS4_BAUVA|nr:hypothetical protein L6164_023119 [Bauhinia variegata]